MSTITKVNEDLGLWAGSEHSYHVAIQGLAAMEAAISSGQLVAAYGEQDDDEGSYLLSMSGDVAVIRITGSLVNKDSPYLKYYGMTGYPEIQRAFVQAYNDSAVKSIVIDADSGGGAVNGVDDTVTLIRQVGASKPVLTFAGGTMASAMYWIGSTASHIGASRTSLVGSIGVMATFMEYTEAMKSAGVFAKVFRAGQYKALANPMEKLTPEAEAQINKSIQATYAIFRDTVAENRRVTVEFAESTMAQGREFVGQEAVAARLVDEITSFSNILLKASQMALDIETRARNNPLNPQGHNTMTSRALTPAQTAAALAAVTAGITAPAATAATTETTTAAAPGANEPAAETTAAAPAAAAPAAAPAASASQDLVAFLQSSLQTSNAEVLRLTSELAQARVASATPVAHQGLMDIVVASLNNLNVALNKPTVDAKGFTADQLVKAYSDTITTFKAVMPVNGVAAGASAAEDTQAATQAAPSQAVSLRLAKATTIKTN